MTLCTLFIHEVFLVFFFNVKLLSYIFFSSLYSGYVQMCVSVLDNFRQY